MERPIQMYFSYGENEILYLSSKDEILGKAICEVGHIYREVNTDLFFSIIYHIIGQQVSVAAQKTIWKRMADHFGKVTADKINKTSINELQSFGITFRKAGYMNTTAMNVLQGELNLDNMWELSDDVIKSLTKLPGIGIWTAEMILLFCMQRPDIFSYEDLAIHRGLCKLYDKEKIDRKQFEKYKKQYSPYGSTASLYLWAIS